jgi:S1-C subfamily serine protease
MKPTITVALLLLVALVACGPDRSAPPPQATVSTPVRDLPLNTSFQDEQPTPVSDDIITQADAEYLLLTNVYERVAPSVVNIEAEIDAPPNSFEQDGTAEASGFIYDLSGYIVTNAHVISDAVGVVVTFNDGFVADAEIVGLDLFSDIAVIKVSVDVSHLRPVTIADSDTIKVGERAIAIGNPFGLNSSMTVGIVSGLGRQLPSAELISNTVMPGFNNPSIIQVDTDINPGNSGGPLLNSRGEVIGINTAIRTESGVFSGVGFAVPSRTIQRVVPSLIENGRMEYAWLGITSLAAEEGLGVAALAAPLNLPVTAGVLIDTIVPDSPASKAGLHGGNIPQAVRGTTVCTGGDIIIAINDVYVDNMDELLSYIVLNTSPGDAVNLLVIRGNESFDLPLTLESRPSGGTSIPAVCGG